MQTVFVVIDIGSGRSIFKHVNVSQIESVEPKYPENKESMATITLLSGRQLMTNATAGHVMQAINKAQDQALSISSDAMLGRT